METATAVVLIVAAVIIIMSGRELIAYIVRLRKENHDLKNRQQKESLIADLMVEFKKELNKDKKDENNNS